jgi:DNA-binding transcriptional ArsR family regulator
LSSDFYELSASLSETFSNARRLKIIELLRDNELCVSAISDSLTIHKSNLSQHLALMREKGIVNARREGRWIYYSIANEKVMQVFDLICELLKELSDTRAFGSHMSGHTPPRREKNVHDHER